MLLLFLAGTAVLMFASVFMRTIEHSPPNLTSFSMPDLDRTPQFVREFEPVKNERIVYPYSVIPGGVRGREELAASISNDRIVAEHFSHFKVSQTRIVNAEETKYVYVSYRMRNKVFWTTKRIRLPKDEKLITDGRVVARTRCGNRVSATPQEPVSQEEPAIDTFDVPMLARLDMPELRTVPEPDLELVEIPRLEPHIPIARPPIVPDYYVPLFVQRPPDVVVPEPGTLSLLIAGLIAFVAVKFNRKK